MLEAKLVQQLAGLAHEPLFQVFLDVRKVYALLDMQRCLELLRGYRMGTNQAQLLESYCKLQRIVPKLVNCLGTSFGTGRGVTQVDPASPMIFNIVVNAVVLEEVCIPQESQHCMVWAAGKRNIFLYADDVMIAGGYHQWLQEALNLDGVQPKISPTISFSGIYQKSFIFSGNRTNYQ